MKGVVLQPSYIPWRGYFDLIRRADVFVFYDDVQYDKHGWRNRNRVKTASGPKWLTIPVYNKGNVPNRLLIKDVEIVRDSGWNRKHLATIQQAYAAAPYFDRYRPLLAEIYAQPGHKLADLTIDLSIRLANELGIRGVQFLRSSELGISGERLERLVKILTTLGVDLYISGPSASAYLDARLLNDHGIGLEYIDYTYPEYEQLHPPYDPNVSIIDLLFMKGPDAASCIW